MNISTWRGLAATCGMVAMLAMPAESQGCEFLRRLFGCGAQTTYMPATAYYAAPAACPAPACNTCAYPTAVYSPVTVAPSTGCAPCGTTSYYAPQTYYRPVVQAVATTTYRPVVIRQAGYPTTVYQPITAFRPQISYAAYASQPVSYAPSYAYAAPAAACSTCPTTVTVPAAATMSVPSTTGTVPTLATPAVTPSTSGDPASVAPTLNPATNSPTYNPQQPSTEATPQSIQNHAPTSPSTDRTTLRPVYPAAPVRMASLTIERTGLNAGGWHAADE